MVSDIVLLGDLPEKIRDSMRLMWAVSPGPARKATIWVRSSRQDFKMSG
jgi:hypothetical protein